MARRETLILRTSRITIKNWVNRSKIVQRKQRKILLLLLFRMTSENDLVLVASEQLQHNRVSDPKLDKKKKTVTIQKTKEITSLMH